MWIIFLVTFESAFSVFLWRLTNRIIQAVHEIICSVYLFSIFVNCQFIGHIWYSICNRWNFDDCSQPYAEQVELRIKFWAGGARKDPIWTFSNWMLKNFSFFIETILFERVRGTLKNLLTMVKSWKN